MPTPIRFKATYLVEPSLLNSGVTYEIGPCEPNDLRLVLIASEPASNTCTLEASASFGLNSARLQMLKSLENGKLPEGSKPDPADKRVDADGSFDPQVVLKLDYLPNTLTDLYHEVDRTLYEIAAKMLRLLRWRYKKQFQFTLRREKGLWWESRSEKWLRFPSYLPAPGLIRVQAHMSHHDSVAEFITKHIEEVGDEPLGHRLMQDARSLAEHDPRAALILSVAAIEVGVKELIAKFIPEAEWLAFNTPSPPVERIIQEYIPNLANLTNTEKNSLFTQDRMDELRKYVQLRNKATHAGREINRLQASKACDSLQELLFCFDVVRSEGWANPG